MTRYTNKETGVTVDIGDDDVLPGSPDVWDSGDGSGQKRTRRRADTGSVPVQNQQ